jgi:hypothetical protein
MNDNGSDTAGALLMLLLGVAVVIRTAKGNLIPALRRVWGGGPSKASKGSGGSGTSATTTPPATPVKAPVVAASPATSSWAKAIRKAGVGLVA